jgi:hypothetical protein
MSNLKVSLLLTVDELDEFEELCNDNDISIITDVGVGLDDLLYFSVDKVYVDIESNVAFCYVDNTTLTYEEVPLQEFRDMLTQIPGNCDNKDTSGQLYDDWNVVCLAVHSGKKLIYTFYDVYTSVDEFLKYIKTTNYNALKYEVTQGSGYFYDTTILVYGYKDANVINNTRLKNAMKQLKKEVKQETDTIVVVSKSNVYLSNKGGKFNILKSIFDNTIGKLSSKKEEAVVEHTKINKDIVL